MKKTALISGLIIAFLLVSVSAIAGSRRYAQDQLDYWVQSAEENNYTVIYSDIAEIRADESYFYTLNLERGYYHFYAEGGEDLLDIDMYVYDSRGDELTSDTLEDNYPICSFELTRAEEIEVEIIAYEFAGRSNRDYFCFVAAMESPPVILTTQDILDYWSDWASDSGYGVLGVATGRLRGDSPQTFTIELDSGYYYIYAESIHSSDDIDMAVYDSRGTELASDALSDNYPICEFSMRRAGTVEIEITGYTYGSGNTTEFAIVVATEDDGIILGGDLTPPGRRVGPPSTTGRITDEADREHVHNLLSEYMDMVIDMGYEMIFDQVQVAEADTPYTFRITLGRGDYIVYGEGGLRIMDLDMRVYDENGTMISEDNMDDNIPICEFYTPHSQTFEIDVYPYEMDENYRQGYFMIVVVRE